MMRKIKFRGKRKDNDEWVYGGFMQTPEAIFIVDYSVVVQKAKDGYPTVYDVVEVIPKTVGQLTGLCDGNGKELDWWEGDVFEVHGRSTLFRIIEEQGCFWFRSSITKERFPCYQAAKWATLPEKLADSQTVFNENPKLLEEKQN